MNVVHFDFDPVYVQGYTAALMDVQDIFNDIHFWQDLKRHKKRLIPKTMQDLAECLINSRAILRENPDTFVRVNSDGNFEVVLDARVSAPDEYFAEHPQVHKARAKNKTEGVM